MLLTFISPFYLPGKVRLPAADRRSLPGKIIIIY